MRALLAVLLVAPSFQDDGLEKVTIGKQQRSLYQGALNAVREASALIDSEPAGALTKIAPVFANADILHREVRLRLEDNFGGYGEWTLFLPYQVRGRANLAQAKKLAATARTEAGRFAQQAVNDLKHSVERKAVSSAPALAEAEKLLAMLSETGPVEDPRTVAARKIIEELRALVDGGGAPDEVIRRCDETAEQVKGTPSETEHGLLRKEAVRRRDDRERQRQEKLMAGLRDWLKTSPTPAAVIARCDELAGDVTDGSLSRELKTIRDGAAGDRDQALRRRITGACDAGRFRDAVEILGAEGGFLPEADRVVLRNDISGRQATRVGTDVGRVRRWLRSNLPPGSAWTGLRRVPDADLPGLFAFPEPGQLVEAAPAIDWCVEIRALLEKCRAAEDVDAQAFVAPLLDCAVRALPVPDLGLEAFSAAAALAHDISILRMEALVASGIDGLEGDRFRTYKALEDLQEPYAAARRALRNQQSIGEGIRKDADGTLDGQRRAFMEAAKRLPQEDRDFGKEMGSFFDPVNPSGFFGDSPFAAFEVADRRCREFLDSGVPRTIEQRRRARAVIFQAAAMKLLLQGESVEKLAGRDDLRELARAGGEVQRADFRHVQNPKVRRLGELLQK